MDFGILLLRLLLGLTLAAHGTQKLFGWFGGYGLAGTGQFFEKLGFHPGRRTAWFAGFTELGAGLMLAFGALTPAAAAAYFATMLVAVLAVHRKQGFFNSGGGYEYPLILGVSALSLAFTGAGRFSLDTLFGLPLSGVVWGLGALALGAGAGLAQMASRRVPAAEPQVATQSS